MKYMNLYTFTNDIESYTIYIILRIYDSFSMKYSMICESRCIWYIYTFIAFFYDICKFDKIYKYLYYIFICIYDRTLYTYDMTYMIIYVSFVWCLYVSYWYECIISVFMIHYRTESQENCRTS